jgi:chaperonin GroES
MALNVKPLGDRILVEAVEEKEVKKGGIIIPDTAKEKPMESVVVALGTGKVDDNGKKVPFEVKKGDRILVSKYGHGNQAQRQGIQDPQCRRRARDPGITKQFLTPDKLWQQNNSFLTK